MRRGKSMDLAAFFVTNRSEIAIRAFRTATELGLHIVAIHAL